VLAVLYTLVAVPLLWVQGQELLGLGAIVAGDNLSVAVAHTLDRRVATLATATAVVSAAIVLLFARWLYLAQGLATAAGLSSKGSPWGAAMTALVPVQNLLRPYQRMVSWVEALLAVRNEPLPVRLDPQADRRGYRERAAFVATRRWAAPPAAGLVLGWAVVWGGARVLAALSMVMSPAEGDPSSLSTQILLAMLGGALNLAAMGLTWRVTRDLGASLAVRVEALARAGEDEASDGGVF